MDGIIDGITFAEKTQGRRELQSVQRCTIIKGYTSFFPCECRGRRRCVERRRPLVGAYLWQGRQNTGEYAETVPEL